MTEIRTIRESETETFLRLLCDVFELDIGRARSIFYNEPFFDLSRKWALFENEHPVSILTTVPLQFGWGGAVGIAGVATRRDRQGEGFAIRLLEHVLSTGESRGETAAFLFARDPRVYLKAEFEIIDEAVRAPIRGTREFVLPKTLSIDEAQAIYSRWSEAHPDRLRRDERRWSYWKWNLRVCTALGEGYLCLEGDRVRECVSQEKLAVWPVPDRTEWFGLRSMAQAAGVPIGAIQPELMLMGWRAPSVPQFFMTDQF